MRKFLLLSMLLLILSACAPATQPAPQPAPPIGEPQIPESEVPRVSLEEAKAALDGKTAVFLDVRGAGSYAASHVPGALSIPLNELEGRLGELDPEQWIITYCTWPNEESSARAAQILMGSGFKHVNPILGGFHAWENAGYPVEASQ